MNTGTDVKNNEPAKLGRVWLTLSAAPVLFLVLIIIASVIVGAQVQGDPQAIAERVPLLMSQILLAAQIILLGVWLWAMRADKLTLADIGWRVADGQSLWREIALGAGLGVALALLYGFALSPLLTWAQSTLGDYVPAGEVTAALGSSLLSFFIANVIFAPFVEENIYRGYALTRLGQHFSPPLAILIACAFFGLLHWTGGFWYIVLTGVVAGGLFSTLFAARRNILAPFAAHLALNTVEFLLIWLMR